MVEWNDGLVIGVKSIDDDHKNLLKIINNFSEAIDRETTTEEFEELFDELDKYIKFHFRREEALLHKCGYTDFENHQAQHKSFANRVPEIKDKFFSSDDYFDKKDIVIFLTDWLVNHIINEDMRFINDLQKSGLIEEKKGEKESWSDKLLDSVTTTISFNKRMYISVIIPLIGMFLFGSIFIWYNYKDYTTVKEVSKVTSSIFNINSLTHSLQTERGLSSGHITASDNKFYIKLFRQRKVSDAAIEQLKDKLKMEAKYFSNNSYDVFIKHIESLKNVRSLVDSKNVSRDKEFTFYTGMINNILSMTSNIAFLHSNKDITYSLSILSSMLNLKEIMGKSRALGMVMIEQGGATGEQSKKFFKLQASQETYFKIFMDTITPRHEVMMNEFLSSEMYKKVQFYKEEILNNNYEALRSTIWFDLSTQNIDSLNRYIDEHINETNTLIQNSIDSLYDNLVIWSIFIFIVIVVTRLVVYMFEKSNSVQIVKLSDGMKSIAAGNRDLRLLDYYNFKDNISEIYESYELTRRALLKSDIYTQMYIEQQKTKVLYQEQLNNRLEEEVNRDGLTKLYNRRYFDTVFSKELSRVQRDRISFTFVMMDIDFFKQYNDTYGHSDGDNVLVAVSDLLRKKLNRSGDFSFRLGGEEFGFFFSGGTLDDVLSHTKYICRSIEELHIEHSGSSVSRYVTASFGLIHLDAESVIIDDYSMYVAADNALYISKKSGRNRVTVYEMNELEIF